MKVTFSLPYRVRGCLEQLSAHFEADVTSERHSFTAGQEHWGRVLARAREVVKDLESDPVERVVTELTEGAST